MPLSASKLRQAAVSAVNSKLMARCTNKSAHAHHEGGAVEQGQPLFGLQFDGMEAGVLERGTAVHSFLRHNRFAFSNQHQGHVGQRGQIAAGPQRPLRWDAGMDAVVEHIDEQLDDRRTHAGITQRQRIGSYQEHGAHDFFGQLRPDADGVAAHQVDLQLFDLVGADDFSL